MDYNDRYKQLNKNQKQAVDTIEGPVMVIAGPGTGKTELLSMRAANILKQTDVLPENILCLTFTENGSMAMRKRLSGIIGRDAYNVSIYTFHAFGTEIINKYREHFYNGAQFKPADTINRHKIISDILQSLPYDDPLKTSMNGKFTNLGAVLTAISEIKRAGLTPDELAAILHENDKVIEQAEPILRDVFEGRVSKATFEKLATAAAALADIQEEQPIASLMRLSDVLRKSLQHALESASNHAKITPPITEWKKNWLTVDAHKKPILKASLQQVKLHSLVQVYRSYLQEMQKAELYDFDDMIAKVVQAIESIPELRYELQEKYQYIMVDEFQDTNLAQMRILLNLTQSDSNNGSPNIMVVGDDDQAIYGFQGADVGNILQFKDFYPSAALVTLTDNYRSAPIILKTARNVIGQGVERLEQHIESLDKTLAAHTEEKGSGAHLVTLPDQASERDWVVREIAEQINNGANPSSIAVLAHRHADLESILPYFAKNNIPISYDRRDNVLENEVVVQLEAIATVIYQIAENKLTDASESLSRLLAHPAWGVAPEVLWSISLRSYRNRTLWIEELQKNEATNHLAQWIIACALVSKYMPLERMLDILIGTESLSAVAPNREMNEYISPLKDYFFSGDPQLYLSNLSNLTVIRNKLREHATDELQPKLADFLSFLEQCRESNTSITSLRHIGDDNASVNLMSAHASKGLEFDTVYILNATDSNWGSKASGGGGRISYPENLRLRQNNNTFEERLRLFFVSMTRAKRQLIITNSHQNTDGKELLLAGFLVEDTDLARKEVGAPNNTEETLQTHKVENEWYTPIVQLPTTSMREQLASTLENYKLSATHINNFIDVSRGGPQHFLLNNLLHFPSARSPHAGYGSAMHVALQQAHDHFRAHGQPQAEEDILRNFEQLIHQERLTKEEIEHFTAKGLESLRAFLAAKYSTFHSNQHAELDFKHQQSQLNDVRLTGKIDVATIDNTNKTIDVVDYKTGAPLTQWGKGSAYQKINSHKYRQQLLFYKLLVGQSRDYRSYDFIGGTLQFIQPSATGEIVALSLDEIQDSELERFKSLIEKIWNHIQELNFPDTSHYQQDYNGIVAFEDDLLAGKI